MASTWRLITHPPSAGDWNMAVDDLLLEQASLGEAACLRLYAWDRPTLSLGYFQSLDEVPPQERAGAAIVRRPTGGGAILHDRELTYAVAVARQVIDGPALYDRVNRAVLRAVRALGIEADVRGRQPSSRAQHGPFFCFARAGATDIIARSRKLAGGAQRRRRGAVLQHGSVLLETGEPGAIGVAQALGTPVAFDRLAAEMVRGFEAEFDARLTPGDLSAEEAERAEQIRRRRYGTRAWLERGNRRRSS